MDQCESGFFLQDVIDVGLFLYQGPQALGAIGSQAKLVDVAIAKGKAYSPAGLGNTWQTRQAGTRKKHTLSQSVSQSVTRNDDAVRYPARFSREYNRTPGAARDSAN